MGPSGTGGRDIKHYPTAIALLSDLATFGLGPDVAAAAERQLASPETRKRFIKFAEDVQIPFEMLEQADIHLFD